MVHLCVLCVLKVVQQNLLLMRMMMNPLNTIQPVGMSKVIVSEFVITVFITMVAARGVCVL